MGSSALILLDTHVLVWAKAEPKRLSRVALREIARGRRHADGLAVSAITLWELAFLLSRGRIQAYGTVEASIETLIAGVVVKPITPEIAALTTQFPDDFPREPADRLISATARAEGLTLVTRDARLRSSPLLKTVW
jgi:PIN domain nuclease of toxin-antitoxin system